VIVSGADDAGILDQTIRDALERHWEIVPAAGRHLHGELDHTYRVDASDGAAVVEVRRDEVVYPDGDLGKVLKIKPPMVFSVADVEMFIDRLDATLGELGWAP
jgi:4-aminobutyrate aminotransferase-like enzyme